MVTIQRCLVLVCGLALLAEGHIAFFSPKEMREMREKEWRKDVDSRSEEGLIEEISIERVPRAEREATLDHIKVKLSAKQLRHLEPALEELLHNVIEAETGV